MDSATKSVIFLLIGLGVIWFLTGGFNKMEGGAFLTPATPYQPSRGYGSSWFSIKKPDSNLTQEEKLAQELEKAKQEAEQIEYNLDKIKEEEKRSSYFGKIEIKSSRASQTDVNKEYLKLKVVKLLDNEQIQISDWKLRSAITGTEVSLGNAVKTAYTSKQNYAQPIFVSGGEDIIITTGRSPIGFSFQVNKCSGYLEQFQDFDPSLNKSCPELENYSLPITGPNHFNDSCLDYIESISKCETPLNFPLDMQNECREFIVNNANHNSCVDNHKTDQDFYKNEWRIFLNRTDELWKKDRETIELLDSGGKIVSSYSY